MRSNGYRDGRAKMCQEIREGLSCAFLPNFKIEQNLLYHMSKANGYLTNSQVLKNQCQFKLDQNHISNSFRSHADMKVFP